MGYDYNPEHDDCSSDTMTLTYDFEKGWCDQHGDPWIRRRALVDRLFMIFNWICVFLCMLFLGAVLVVGLWGKPNWW